MPRTLSIALAIALLGCGSAPANAPASPPATPTPAAAVAPLDVVPPPREDGHLPGGAHPTSYALDLAIDPARTSFSGRARIQINVDQPTRSIVMHGRAFTVRSAVLSVGSMKLPAAWRQRPAAFSREEPEELVLTFGEAVPVGPAEIEIAYDAPFSNGLRGAYRVQEGGAPYVFTHFEPNDARRAFPCFDEPAFKTPFELSITVPKGVIAAANTNEIRRSDADSDHVKFEFARTKPLPSYLVAFGVGPLDVLEGAKEPAPVRLIAAKGKTEFGKLSVEAAAAQLELLGKYFDRPYPYPKLDVVAVPNFGVGAMENAGFITFREELLLLDPQHASTMARRAMGGVTAHELAHQWFGDLVTMQWWDDVWLNEAFASWMGDKIVDQWRPVARARIHAIENKSHVMEEDSLTTTRKIRNPVRSTSDASEAFDGITYNKGKAVLSMTEGWLGESTFRDGIRRYLKSHEWGNATAADLYAALGETSGRDVAKVMNTFTDQTGLPVVRASLECGSRPTVVLRQEEYRTLDRKEPSDKLWRIPVCVSYEAAGKVERRCTLLDGAEGRIDLGDGAKCPAFYYPNAGESGYFRVRLDPGDRAKLVASAGKLPEQERFGILANAWAEVWSGDLSAAKYFELVRAFKNDKSRLVWAQIVDGLFAADRAVITDADRPAFTRFVRSLLGPAAHRVGWTPQKNETDDDKLLRESLIGALGSLGEDEWALGEAKRVAQAWLADPMKVDADLARIAVPLAARKGNLALADQLSALLKAPKTPEIRLIALAGLSSFEDPALIERTLALALDGTIKSQDFRYVFIPLEKRRATRDATYAWLEKHFDEIARVSPAAWLNKFVFVVSAMCDSERVHSASAFFRPRLERIEGTERNMRQSAEEGLRCAALAQKEARATSEWLAAAR